jgi:nucleoside-diphosphate-sugar epimerase
MIFLTGATGFVGRNILNGLDRAGIKTISLVRSEKDVKIFSGLKNAKYIIGNLFSMGDIIKALPKIEIVIHLASSTNPLDPNIFNTNLEGTRGLLRLSSLKKVKRFIYLSSLNVEEMRDKYASSKFLAEKLVEHSNLSFDIIRPPTIYGRYDNKNLSKIIKNLRSKKRIITFPGYRNSYFVSVEEVVRVVLNCVLDSNNEKDSKIRILTEPMTHKDLILDLISRGLIATKAYFLPKFLMKLYYFFRQKNKISKKLEEDIEDFQTIFVRSLKEGSFYLK